MGYYLNVNSKGEPLPSKGKAAALMLDGAKVTDNTYKPNLVCVISNPVFDAAAYAYNEDERNEFADTSRGDNRPRMWLVYEHAAELSGYKEKNPLKNTPYDGIVTIIEEEREGEW